MEFKGTKGEWKVTMEDNGNCFIHPPLGAAIARVYTENEHFLDSHYNAELIAEAGNVRQKIDCSLTELLERYEEMRVFTEDQILFLDREIEKMEFSNHERSRLIGQKQAFESMLSKHKHK